MVYPLKPLPRCCPIKCDEQTIRVRQLTSDNLKETSSVSTYSDIDYEGFRWFLDTFLEVSTPDELSRHLFLSFVRRDRRPALREMAAASSAAACAAVTAHADHQVGKLNIASKIHGLAERLQQLGRSSGDSVEGGDKASRSRTGSVHPMFGVTAHPSHSAYELCVDRRTDTSPSHSQMSRNSSRKSSNSLRVNQGKIEDFRHLIRRSSTLEVHTARVSLKDIVCYLSLLEAGRPEDKLELRKASYRSRLAVQLVDVDKPVWLGLQEPIDIQRR
ncbi:Diacylglycerol kinase 1 [Eumeta japonica]|uniref:Diacylglycerol kinase 1 n=1 Tax=Eumeta variegata TaxID=151549 RepID=A0A4C1Z103_EUMVA|nr:Diacylglycerol kinase 1 [Eumeta japonica]